MSLPKSQRELLFSRVNKQKMGDSLARNLQKLAQTEERLKTSRLSSASSSSINSLRRAYSTASQQKSNSKEKLLKEILDKLREARPGKEMLLRESRQGGGEEIGRGQDSRVRNVRGSRMSKLEEMMKDIKKCNQMSTKAVYSIKKNVKEKLSSATHTNEDNNSSSHILLLVNQLSALKQELSSIKLENKQLISIIQQRDKQCKECGCHCHTSK